MFIERALQAYLTNFSCEKVLRLWGTRWLKSNIFNAAATYHRGNPTRHKALALKLGKKVRQKRKLFKLQLYF